MSLNLALSAGISGLQTAQKGLDSVAHNLANVNTPGYTRKVFNPESVVLAGNGVGVQTGGLIRRVDEGLNENLRVEIARLEQLDTASTYFDRMQDLFGTPGGNSSISHRIGLLSEAFESLALEPDKSSTQLATLSAGENVIQQFNKLTTELQEMRSDADQEIEATVDAINERLAALDNLNEEITLGLSTERDVTDLLDKRDLELQELNALIEVSSFERSGGALVVYSARGSVLLDAEPRTVSFSASSQVSAWDTYGGNDFSTVLLDGEDITNEAGTGKLAALVELRDQTLVNYQSQLDELAVTMKETINQVHNRGTSYPNVTNSYEGSRTFLDSATQAISLTPPDDVMMTIFDTDGVQTAAVSLNTIMQDTNLDDAGAGAVAGTGTDHGANGPWTIDQMMGKMQSWLRSPAGAGLTTATAAVNSTGQVDIALNDNNHSLAFRDQTSGTTGATAEDAAIQFDKNGDGNADETIDGFSNFLGLNDFFVSERTKEWVFDSGVKSSGWTPNISGTLQFYDESNPPGTGAIGSLTVKPNWTLDDIASAINGHTTLGLSLEAEVVQEGSGARLRIKNRAGEDMVITQLGSSTNMIDQLGLKKSAVGLSGEMDLNSTLTDNPERVSRGAVLYNSDIGEYYLSRGDNTTANDLAGAFQATVAFDSAGGLTTGNRTLADYAALIVNQNASEAAIVESDLEYQAQLADSLSLKQAEISSVNMDEELSQLLVWEQMYNAAAKVISTTADMLDVLNSIIR